jgi:hypothetical protein
MIFAMTALVLSTFAQDPVSVVEPSLEWTRRTAGENVVSIELVSRRYEAEGLPDLWLVGVAHIAEESFYDDVAMLLDEMDIVLYESVRPAGSRQPGGSTEEERVESTKKSLEFVADVAKRAAEEAGILPETLEEVIADSSIVDRRLSGWVEDASVDAWGRPFALQVNHEDNTVTFWSFGSDGAVGGSGSAADLTSTRTIEIEEIDLSELDVEAEVEFTDEELENIEEEVATDKGMQEEFADILGLEFQLDALPYEDPTWFCSDLTIDEVESKLEERGADASVLGTISGESFTAKVAVGLMKMIPVLDSLTNGGVKETAKLLMIEILSMPQSDQMLEGIEPELAQVIIVDRNTELLNDVAATIEIAEDLTSIGVLYGAGHMADLSPRLKSLFGYEPVEEKWFTAMSVNPNDSLLDEKYMRQMRVMLQVQLRNAEKKKAEKE